MFSICKCTFDELAMTNLVYVAPGSFPPSTKYIRIVLDNYPYIFSMGFDKNLHENHAAFTLLHRKWAPLRIGKSIEIKPHTPTHVLHTMSINVKLHNCIQKEAFQCDDLQDTFLKTFNSFYFSKNRSVLFTYKNVILIAHVEYDDSGVMDRHCVLKFNITDLMLTGTEVGRSATNLIQEQINLEQYGIGGLGKEFQTIFRRAFASRVLPPDMSKKMGIDHVRGILLYGPPGTGKTLMARQIGKMLNASTVTKIAGPEVLDSLVGGSEKKIRALFEPAEEEFKTQR